jgi:hypothetical protein
MASVPKLKFKVDLKDLFGHRIESRALREAIGGAILEKIKQRTEKGEDINGETFKGYSKDYRDSLEFKVWKGNKRKPDLTQSGDMLAAMTIIDQNSQSLTFGFADDENNAKAYNHNTGDTVPKREFFGVNSSDLAEIEAEFADEVGAIEAFELALGTPEFERRAIETLAVLLDEGE